MSIDKQVHKQPLTLYVLYLPKELSNQVGKQSEGETNITNLW